MRANERTRGHWNKWKILWTKKVVIDWLIDWSNDGFIGWVVDWLIEWDDWLIDWLIDWMGWFIFFQFFISSERMCGAYGNSMTEKATLRHSISQKFMPKDHKKIHELCKNKSNSNSTTIYQHFDKHTRKIQQKAPLLQNGREKSIKNILNKEKKLQFRKTLFCWKIWKMRANERTRGHWNK